MKAFQSEDAFVEQIPIEGLEMSDIEDDAVPLGDGAIVEKIGLDHAKQVVGALAGVCELFNQIVTDDGISLRGWHSDLPISG